jgi:ATP/maltotriose-dependent transcriptional regulator MalT
VDEQTLTSREIEVLKLVAGGNSNKRPTQGHPAALKWIAHRE